MSQVSIIDIEGNHPQIPTRFNANTGFAIPIANVLEIYGNITTAGSSPVHTVGSGNNITTYVQLSQAIAATDSTKVGLSAFNSSHFSVDANGFVSLVGGGEAIDSIAVQTGTSPIVPTVAGLVTINGAVVAAGTNPIRSNGTGANTLALEVQISQAIAAADATKIGLANFSSTDFAVTATGFVTLSTTGAAKTITGQSGGALSPTANNWNIFGASAVAGTSPVSTIGSVSTLTVKVQTSQALAATDATKIGLSNFNSSHFSVDVNGFVSLLGGGEGIDSIGVQTGTNPITPTLAGLVTINGAVVAAGTNPIRTNGTGANTLAVEVQIAQAIAAADATKIGLSNFSTTDFAVAPTGFVTFSTTGAGKTITGQSGGALSPTANNWNIFGAVVAAGTSPVATSGSGSTLTTNVQISQAIASTDVTKIGLSNFNSAYFSVDANGFVSATGAIAIQYTADSGTATPAAGNLNILGGPGITTSATGSTVTINSVVFTDTSGSFIAASDNGYFLTAASTPTLPAAPAQGEVVIFVCDTSSTVTVTANTGQKIRIADQISATAGTAVNTAQGDVLVLRYRSSGATWFSVSSEGNWSVT